MLVDLIIGTIALDATSTAVRFIKVQGPLTLVLASATGRKPCYVTLGSDLTALFSSGVNEVTPQRT